MAVLAGFGRMAMEAETYRGQVIDYRSQDPEDEDQIEMLEENAHLLSALKERSWISRHSSALVELLESRMCIISVKGASIKLEQDHTHDCPYHELIV